MLLDGESGTELFISGVFINICNLRTMSDLTTWPTQLT